MGRTQSLANQSTQEHDLIAAGLSGQAHQGILVELLNLHDFLQAEAQARREVCYFPSHQHEICPAKQLNIQKYIYKLLCHSQLSKLGQLRKVKENTGFCHPHQERYSEESH